MFLVTQLIGDKMRLFKNKFVNWILILDYNNMWWHLNREKSFFQSYGILGFFKNFNNDLVDFNKWFFGWKLHYYYSWFLKRFKLINKSFFTSGHVHFDHRIRAWMTCLFLIGKLAYNDLFDYMSNWTSN